mgnify:CR=1 FL=1|tara:strand:- start:490 stop:1014 length:525 start_codon:yes stop_codon:yes gene_type:complete
MNDQLILFPDESSLTIEKGIDFIDLKDLVQTRTDSFKKFGRDKYFIYKTGGINPFMPEEGKVFPFVHNKKTGHILQPTLMGGIDSYPKLSLGSEDKQDTSPVKVTFHWLVGAAFIINNMPEKKKIVHHRNHNTHDYRIPNLQWVTHTYNSEKINPRVNQQELREQARQIHERKQ